MADLSRTDVGRKSHYPAETGRREKPPFRGQADPQWWLSQLNWPWHPRCWKSLVLTLFVGAVVSSQMSIAEGNPSWVCGITANDNPNGKSSDMPKCTGEHIVIS